MRVMGIDFGDKNTGIALSDPFLWTASGHTVLRRKNPIDVSETIASIQKIIKDYEVKLIVLGFPKNMDNSEGLRCEKTVVFQKQLTKKIGLEVILWDERLSTRSAERVFREASLTEKQFQKDIDKLAAVFILKGYLDSLSQEEKTVLIKEKEEI